MPSACDWSSDVRSEEHTSELQSRSDLVCRLLLEKKNTQVSLLWIKFSRAQNGSDDKKANADLFVPLQFMFPKNCEERCAFIFFLKAATPPKINLFPQPPPFPS